MRAGRAMELLSEHYREISVILRSSRDVLVPNTPETLDAVATLRWQLMRALRAYQLFKHGEVFDPLAASSDPAISASAKNLKERCLTIGEEYTAFVTRWSTGAAARAWEDYRVQACRMVERIEEHLRTEKEEVRALTSRIDRTRRIVMPGDRDSGLGRDR